MKKNVCKICRRAGQKLFLKGERCLSPKCAVVKKSYPPGQKSKRRRGAPSDFGKELKEKQKLKQWYRLSERQFKKYVKEILAKTNRNRDLEEELIKKLERRLDNVIFRLGLAKSRDHARQLVSHGFFEVNKKSIDVPSFEVKEGDIISVKEQKKEKPALREIKMFLKKQTPPSWLKIDKEKVEAEVTGDPSLEGVSPPADIPVIFEFYSR